MPPETAAPADAEDGGTAAEAKAVPVRRAWFRRLASQRLTARIINAQTDEIAIMQTWLKDRQQPVPTVDSTGQVTMPAAAGGFSVSTTVNAPATGTA